MYFRLLGTNGFHVKAENEDLLLQARVVVRTSNMKISRRRLVDYVTKLHQKACCACSTIIFPHSINQIIDLWRCRCRRQILNSLISHIREVKQGRCRSTTARTSSENLSTCFCKNFSMILSRLAFKMYSNYPGIKLISASDLGSGRKKLKICQASTSFT